MGYGIMYPSQYLVLRMGVCVCVCGGGGGGGAACFWKQCFDECSPCFL